MLTCYGHDGKAPQNWQPGGAVRGDCVWIDAFDPNEDERRCIEQATGLPLPSLERIRSVELSSRLGLDGDALRLNVPHFPHGDGDATAPVGLIVAPKFLVSLRYADSPVFAELAARLATAPAQRDGAGVFATLAELIVGKTADRLESVAADVGELSERLFALAGSHRYGAQRDLLNEIGRLEGGLARARLASSGVERILAFAHDSPPAWVAKADLARMKIAQKDLVMLGELDMQLTDKLQFLLDATLGFINIDQNEVMKVLTVASVATIPPIVLAGIWGMNFAHMPELHLRYGYPLALAAIALSTVMPLIWFRLRGWL
ncbi:MAG TPA: CorA family divalent cation transporter [Dokdonella sp.]